MYSIGRKVAINAPGSGYHNQAGHIADRRYVIRNGKRQASYLVEYKVGHIRPVTYDVDGLSSKQLKPLDGWCDSCDRPCRDSQLRHMHDPNGDILVSICWFCENVDYKNEPEPYPQPTEDEIKAIKREMDEAAAEDIAQWQADMKYDPITYGVGWPD